MNLKRVPVRLDEPTERPLIPGLRGSQQETLIVFLFRSRIIVHHVKRPQEPKLIARSPRCMGFRKVTRAATVPLIGDIRSVPEEIPTRQRIE